MQILSIFHAGLSSRGHPQILEDQLTNISQPRGADYAHQIILAPPDFQTLLRPCLRPAARVISRYNFYDISLSVNKSDSLQNLSFMQCAYESYHESYFGLEKLCRNMY